MASTTPTSMRPKEAVKPDLWKQALATLNAEDQKQYEDCSSSIVCGYSEKIKSTAISKSNTKYVLRGLPLSVGEGDLRILVYSAPRRVGTR